MSGVQARVLGRRRRERRGPTPADGFAPKTRGEPRSATATSQTADQRVKVTVSGNLWVYVEFRHICNTLKYFANLCKQHENDVGRVEVQRRHHVLVEEDELIRRSVGGEERRDERTETPLLQDGLQDAAALLCITLNEHLCTTQAGATRD